MAIRLKTSQEIEIMREGGKILAEVLAEVKKEVRPGVSTLKLDNFVERLLNQRGGKPSFKMVKNYNWATCMCVNEIVVHGVPVNYKLKKGDILGIDIGLFYKGFHTDMAETVIVDHFNDTYHRSKSTTGRQDLNHLRKFIAIGKKALEKAISMARVGHRVGHISKAIQETIEGPGFSPVRALVGHGIGKNLHEEPQIPCFLGGKIGKTPQLKIGMTLAIEVIYNQGSPEVIYKNDDGWTIRTADGKLSGLFEHTVAVLPSGPEILTRSK